MTETKKTEPQAAPAPDPVKADVEALKAEVKGYSERFDKLEALLTKASKPEATVETKEPDVVAQLTDKKSVASDDKKEDPVFDWSKPVSKPGDLKMEFGDFLRKIRSK